MFSIRSSWLGVVIITNLVACQPPPTGFFTANVYLRPYETNLSQSLTIILGESIADEFNIGGMEVFHFRKSLAISLYYTFENSVPEILFSDSIAEEGITLHLYRIRPEWDIKNAWNSITVVDGTGTSSTLYEIRTLIRYDGVVYKDGEKWLVLDHQVASEQTAFRKKQWPGVFQDGVRELCEDLYQKITQSPAKAVR